MARGHFKKAKRNTSLNITSMMDMFTIILLFLLKSFSADGSMLTNADNLILPNSISNKRPQELPLQVAVTQDFIMVDNAAVVDTKSVFDRNQEEYDEDTTSALDLALKEKMDMDLELLRIGALKEVKGEIIVQVDKNINFDVMYKVMRTCGRQGYTNMKFAVMMREQ
jgi:biopolymer transport protein ExbD